MATRTTGKAGQELSGPGHVEQRNLRTLSAPECFGLLELGDVGRVGLPSPEGIVIMPVNFAVAGMTIVFRTAPDTLLAAHADGPVSFEADFLDKARHEGWSVLVQGHAHEVTSEREVRSLERETRLEPWADGARDVWVRISPARISGRVIERATRSRPAPTPGR